VTDDDAGVVGGPDPSRRVPTAGPPAAFLDELAAAFRRLSPQGSADWNFSDAFGRLEAAQGDLDREAAASKPDGGDPGASGADAGGGPPSPAADEAGGHSRSRVPANRNPRVLAEAWLDSRIRSGAEDAARRVIAVGPVHESVAATVEAFRFLAARVQRLEDAAARGTAPIDGLAWLVDPPPLDRWVDQAVLWLTDPGPGGAGPDGDGGHGSIVDGDGIGPVVVAECGTGELAVALGGAGLAVRAAEPRGTVAWQAAEAGVDVHVGQAAELLEAAPLGSLGGVVLAGVIDRVSLDQQVQLLALATDRLATGAPLLVVGTRPDAAVYGWPAVARDLVPGRPLHPETWQLLLDRAGYTDVAVVDNAAAGDTYAVRGRR